jgi:hypothetical protein
MIRQSRFGTPAYVTMALERFPPPAFLTPTQVNIWTAALGDFPLEFFRARHLPVMIQYVRAVEHMMKFSDEFESDPEDMIAFNRWTKMMTLVRQLERQLSFSTAHLIDMVIRARSELKLSQQNQRSREAGEQSASPRRGLVYVGH